MNRRLIIVLVLASTSWAACVATQSLPSGHRIGEAMHAQGAHRLSVVDSSPEDFFHKTVLVEATVSAVCQNMGCWMQIEDHGSKAMVRWETGCGGKYAFPKNIVGKHVLIQGSFYSKHIDEADALEIEGESSGGVVIPREGWELEASSVLILDA